MLSALNAAHPPPATIGGTHPPVLLIHDQLINRLDVYAVEQLEAGLRGHHGALIMVSQDRRFLKAAG